MATKLPLEERETIILFNEKDATAEITTYNEAIINRMAELEIDGEEGEDGSMEFECPKGLITIGKVRKARAPRNLTREQKDEKLRQLRVGKRTKWLMANEGMSEADAQESAEKTYGTAGKAKKAAKPGNDPFSKENAPQRPSNDEAEDQTEDSEDQTEDEDEDEDESEEEAPKQTKAQQAKAKKAAAKAKKANAGLDD